jgi:hypothetical protein
MSELQERATRIINALTQSGWVADGYTSCTTVRMPTRNSPLYGRSGGKLVSFGGRVRLKKGDRFVTVGQKTVCFYINRDGKLSGFTRFLTKEETQIIQEGSRIEN